MTTARSDPACQYGMHALLRFTPLDATTGGRAGTHVEATSGLLSWAGAEGRIRLAHASPDVFTSYVTGRPYRVTALSGSVAEVSGDQVLGAGERGVIGTAGPGGIWEAAIEELDSTRLAYTSSERFDAVVARAERACAAFVDAVAPWHAYVTPAAELAACVVWSAAVRPAALVTWPAVLMSKHWMDNGWSWDRWCVTAPTPGPSPTSSSPKPTYSETAADRPPPPSPGTDRAPVLPSPSTPGAAE